MRLETAHDRVDRAFPRAAASLLAFLALTFVLRPSPAVPAVYQRGDTVLLDAGADDDAYLAGGKIVVTAGVDGDAVAAGGSIVVNAPVAGDLVAAGGSIVVGGEVSDDLRGAGGDITISQPVGDDLAAAGGQVTVGRNAAVGGDAAVAAGKIDAAGPVAGNARLYGGRVVFTGDVAGDADFFAAEYLEINGRIGGRARFSAPEVRLGPAAAFGGDVEYWTGRGELDFGTSPPAGEVRFNPAMTFARVLAGKDMRREGAAGLLAAWTVFSVLSGALAILVLLLVARGYFGTAADDLRQSPWRSFGMGVLYFLVVPAAAAVLFATIVGVPLGLALLALYLLSLLFAKVLASLVLARWVERRRERTWSTAALFFAALGFFLALKVAMLVPVVGWIAALFAVCTAFGAMVSADWRLVKQLRAAP